MPPEGPLQEALQQRLRENEITLKAIEARVRAAAQQTQKSKPKFIKKAKAEAPPMAETRDLELCMAVPSAASSSAAGASSLSCSGSKLSKRHLKDELKNKRQLKDELKHVAAELAAELASQWTDNGLHEHLLLKLLEAGEEGLPTSLLMKCTTGHAGACTAAAKERGLSSLNPSLVLAQLSGIKRVGFLWLHESVCPSNAEPEGISGLR